MGLGVALTGMNRFRDADVDAPLGVGDVLDAGMGGSCVVGERMVAAPDSALIGVCG